MGFVAGQKLHASDLNFFIVGAACSADTTTSGGATQDVTGATVTFATTHTNVIATVTGVFDMENATYTAVVAGIGHLSVDGSDQSAQAIFQGTALAARACVTQCWTITLASAGSHTLKLRIGGGSAGTHVTVHVQHSTINALVLDV